MIFEIVDHETQFILLPSLVSGGMDDELALTPF